MKQINNDTDKMDSTIKVVIDSGYGFYVSIEGVEYMAKLGCKQAASEMKKFLSSGETIENFYGTGYSEKYPEEYDRTNPFLIKAIEDLGTKANGWNANLKIIEIPSNVKYYIVEDEMGGESIHEDHRVWY